MFTRCEAGYSGTSANLEKLKLESRFPGDQGYGCPENMVPNFFSPSSAAYKTPDPAAQCAGAATPQAPRIASCH